MQLKQLKKELHIKPEKIQETNLSIRAVNNSFPSCGGFISQSLVAETNNTYCRSQFSQPRGLQ